MRLLLDTCTLLWCASDPDRLSGPAMEAVTNERNDLVLSVVSGWEIKIKAGLGKLTLPGSPNEFLDSAFVDLRLAPIALEWSDLRAFERLAGSHRDPFDRLLACQALARDIQIITPDRQFAEMGATVLW